MKISYSKLLLGTILAISTQQAKAQFVVDGTRYTNFGYVSNYESYTNITNATGSIYTAASGAIFDHNDTDPNSLRVNNTYNANGTGGSTDNFNGPGGVAGTQGVSGSVAPDFSTLVLKNGASSLFQITNSAGANVFQSASFQNGVTTTNRSNAVNGALRFQDGATYTGGTTNARHVNGYVGKVGNDAFVFPVGSGTAARTLSITAPASATAQISVAYDASNVEDASVMQAPMKAIFPGGSWDWIVKDATDDDNMGVSVSIPEVSGMGTASDLRLVGWNGTMWMDLSGAANASGTSAGSTLSGTIPPDENITQIGIGSIMNPLPISLVDFNVKKGDQETALLYWTAVMDLMSDRFEIERNVDGKNWEKLGTIIAKDGNQRLANYNFTDSDTKKGLNLYRLKMIDKNATFTYSLIRSLEFGNTRKDKVILYPNPATQIITLDVDDISSIERIQIRDVNGRILLDQQKRPVRNLPKSFNLKHFASGTYIATITGTDGAVISVKVVKR